MHVLLSDVADTGGGVWTKVEIPGCTVCAAVRRYGGMYNAFVVAFAEEETEARECTCVCHGAAVPARAFDYPPMTGAAA